MFPAASKLVQSKSRWKKRVSSYSGTPDLLVVDEKFARIAKRYVRQATPV